MLGPKKSDFPITQLTFVPVVETVFGFILQKITNQMMKLDVADLTRNVALRGTPNVSFGQ